MLIKSSTLTKYWGDMDLFFLDLLFEISIFEYVHENVNSKFIFLTPVTTGI